MEKTYEYSLFLNKINLTKYSIYLYTEMFSIFVPSCQTPRADPAATAAPSAVTWQNSEFVQQFSTVNYLPVALANICYTYTRECFFFFISE